MLAQRRPPWYLILPAVATAAGVAVPLAYLLVRGLGAGIASLAEVGPVLAEMAGPLGRTLLLLGGVLAVILPLALLTAWLTAWTDLPARRAFALLAVMPLAVPGYVTAYALLGLGGYYGLLSQLLDTNVPRLSGFWGALLALSAYNFPYVFLNVRAAMADLDPSLEEAARSLGHGRWDVLRQVILPQLRPACFAGALLVTLHVVADFGVVSLMRYDTLSRVLYTKYRSLDQAGAARVGLVLLGLTFMFVAAEMWFLRRLRLDRAGTGSRRRRRPVRLGWLKAPAGLLLLAMAGLSVAAPTAVVIYWLTRADFWREAMAWEAMTSELWDAVGHSVQASLPAALGATALAVPIALLRARYPSRRSLFLERLPYLGYATPALAFALSLIFLSIRLMEWTEGTVLATAAAALYQSLPLLIYAYVLHFLAEAVGPVRSSMYLATPRLEEASRALGVGRVATFFRITLPVLRHGLVVSLALVFLSCMKELPLTMLLAPFGFETLATNVWAYSEEANFAGAAPYALTILLCSAGFVGVLLWQGRDQG